MPKTEFQFIDILESWQLKIFMVFVVDIQMDILEDYYLIFYRSEALISTLTNNKEINEFYRKICDDYRFCFLGNLLNGV